MKKIFVTILILSFNLNVYPSTETAFSINPSENGKICIKNTKYGKYLQYIPKSLSRPTKIAVLVHGSIGKKENALAVAEVFIKRWIHAAEEQNCILLAPAFDQENFGGGAGPGGGYRGLFGRIVGADVFINHIVDQYKSAFPTCDGRFYLYGHSAGGQLISRYIVMHPERIIAAVISAAGTFAFPDPNVPWTNGMARLRRKMRWSDTDPWKQIDIQPNPENWLRASQLPITVVVGAKDTDRISKGQKGSTHVKRASWWVKDMRRLAYEHNEDSNITLRIVKNVGHSSAKLTPASIKYLFDKHNDKTKRNADDAKYEWKQRKLERQQNLINHQTRYILDLTEETFEKNLPCFPETTKRRLALSLLDCIFHDINSSQTLAAQEYVYRRMKRVMQHIENTAISEGAMIWKLYNHAFIVRTRAVTMAFDLIRPSTRFPNYTLQDNEIFTNIIEQCDILFVSHGDADHTDPWIMQKFIDDGKPVVAPDDFWKDKQIYRNITHLERKKHKTQILPIKKANTQLEVVIYPGHQKAINRETGEPTKIEVNVALVKTPEGLSFIHTGDQNIAEDYSWIGEIHTYYKVDVLFYNYYLRKINNAIKGFNPKLLITGHENEIGHDIGGRVPYWKVRGRIDSSDYPYIIMTWGESFHYRP